MYASWSQSLQRAARAKAKGQRLYGSSQGANTETNTHTHTGYSSLRRWSKNADCKRCCKAESINEEEGRSSACRGAKFFNACPHTLTHSQRDKNNNNTSEMGIFQERARGSELKALCNGERWWWHAICTGDTCGCWTFIYLSVSLPLPLLSLRSFLGRDGGCVWRATKTARFMSQFICVRYSPVGFFSKAFSSKWCRNVCVYRCSRLTAVWRPHTNTHALARTSSRICTRTA